MKDKYIIRTIGYLFLIWGGWFMGEYPHIPSFTLGFIRHTQPPIEQYDKCIAFALLAFSLTIFFALWKNFWIMVSMMFITWGMFNNFVDEVTNQASVFTTAEQVSLLFALLTTSILIWKAQKK